jgi:hypothetical protein
MTREDVRKLKLRDRVRHTDGTLGTVTDVGWSGATVEWDDGQFAMIGTRDAEDSDREPLRLHITKLEASE